MSDDRRSQILEGHIQSFHPEILQHQLCTSHLISKADYYFLDDFLNSEEKELRYKIRHFMETEVKPVINEYYEKGEFPLELLPKLAQVIKAGGIAKGYGCPGRTILGEAVVVMEMARVDASFATFFMVHGDVAMAAIDLCGSEEQKQRFLPPMSRFEFAGSFALTEPLIGSDASGITTTARKCRRKSKNGTEEEGWVLNGHKRWIGNVSHAGAIIVWARVENSGGQINGFIVEKGCPGLKIDVIKNKISMRCVQNADFVLDNCFISEKNRLLSDSFQTGPVKVLNLSRILAAWLPLGISMGAFDSALQYLNSRKQFGVKMTKFQIVQEKLMRILGNIQAMALMAWRSTMLLQEGRMTHGHSSLCKAMNTLRGRECVALARELVGGNGIVTDFHVAKCFTDMEAAYTYEGTYDINMMITGREVTGEAAFKMPVAKKD